MLCVPINGGGAVFARRAPGLRANRARKGELDMGTPAIPGNAVYLEVSSAQLIAERDWNSQLLCFVKNDWSKTTERTWTVIRCFGTVLVRKVRFTQEMAMSQIVGVNWRRTGQHRDMFPARRGRSSTHIDILSDSIPFCGRA